VKIVDLRPMLVRRFARSDTSPAPPSFLSILAGRFSDALIRRRVSGRPQAAGVPLLVSIGNLALGGTGKTPVVISLACALAKEGIKGAVLTRGYGSSLAGPLVVDEANQLAGDEARMMAGRLKDSGWSVVQSRNRPLGMKYLQMNHADLEIILLEDAFQTSRLARHVDLVILDSWLTTGSADSSRLEPVTGATFPFGPWRETAEGASRASAILVEGGPDLPALSSAGQPVFSFGRSVKLKQVRGPAADPAEGHWALVSGIARPEKFENSAMELLGEPVVLALRCQDHVKYSKRLVKTILNSMNEAGARSLVTTAKDWVKLSGVWPDGRPVMVLDMELEWEKKEALNQWLVERLRDLKLNQSSETAP